MRIALRPGERLRHGLTGEVVLVRHVDRENVFVPPGPEILVHGMGDLKIRIRSGVVSRYDQVRVLQFPGRLCLRQTPVSGAR